MPGVPAGGAGTATIQDTTQYQSTIGTSEDGHYAESSVQGIDAGSQPPYPVSEAERLEQRQATEQNSQPQPTAYQHVA